MAIETQSFEKVDFANATKVVRPTLGNEAPIALFRLVRLILLEDMFGSSSTAQAYLSGKNLGYSLGLKDGSSSD
ncbi:hypothetical protein [Acidithiobacillus ferrooxidans]|uniref:hypothetical protein n=1 Tax=Acidithiobacillus ferrooxidans TaxID=920 RepID=UPI0015DC369F|nr:hypothetical protein [Acidithiobacillus ferrooxidans]QLK43777.1 hypothetical protein FE661_16660 [Acidithiobacillus ferrooxidans]QZT54341.1 hypothetical protein K7B00_16555 [Acidithiobacillus ferrooxidans]BDB15980.1 hypothetical protein ANFP_33000 [Acidithiobacillus ferrooxidans]